MENMKLHKSDSVKGTAQIYLPNYSSKSYINEENWRMTK